MQVVVSLGALRSKMATSRYHCARLLRRISKKYAAVAAGEKVCRVNFGNEYVQERRVSVAPLVLATGVGGTQTWRAASITPTGYDLVSDSGVAAGETANLQVLAEPARR